MKKIIFLLVLVVGIGIVSFLSKQSEAASGDAIDIVFDDTTYGKVNQSMVITLESGTTNQQAQGIVSSFNNSPVYIKLVNPTTSSVAATPFQTISNAGFKWYFLFTQNSSVTAVLDAYKHSYPLANLVVELEMVDASFIQTLKTNYPGIRVHAGHLPVWPRSRVNEIYGMVQPPAIEGISFWIGTINRGNVFDDIKLTFDTFFDASKSIAGEEVNHPADAILSVSEAQYPPYTDEAQRSAYLFGLVSSAIVSSVQSQNRSGEAPIRYINPGGESDKEKAAEVLYSWFLQKQPDVVWPMAISNNGDPWDNDFFEESNTKPLVGVIGKIPEGYFGFITNTSASIVRANFGNKINSNDYATLFANGSQSNNFDSEGVATLGPHQTLIFHPKSIQFPITPTITPGQNTPTPTSGSTPTTRVINCNAQQVLGDFDCSLTVDEMDFTRWKESFAAGSSLSLFEYWRRAFHL